MNIAVLDDNAAILDYVETVLVMDSHTVSRHLSSQSLLDAIFAHVDATGQLPYDLVVLDLMLPGKLSGADVFIRLRKNFSETQLPLVIITAVSNATLEQFRQILPDDVALLRKPFSPRALRQLIKQYEHPSGRLQLKM
ncbi:response regulator [Tengunoibacter tsumagoiensis]|uniref:Response regulatory domain-containing protein n=1 Tax=Tengunoibacter tsumagoiensis TaxID=2014871 RepID=A0A402AAF9_9CHLR|nr:response regulator [Tengunoibacter tsumagoiensis]GCE16147.1 hypothetical protein KTT_60060 [Tengunoibacter tsumagoiensis]